MKKIKLTQQQILAFLLFVIIMAMLNSCGDRSYQKSIYGKKLNDCERATKKYKPFKA